MHEQDATDSDEDQPTVHSVLAGPEWLTHKEAHEATVDALTAAHRNRVSTHRNHPVEDFLFTYYTLRPAQLRRWNPGVGVALLDAEERAGWRFHRTLKLTNGPRPALSAVVVDTSAFLEQRRPTVEFIGRLLSATAAAPANFGCFGLHEWAMVYRTDENERRHEDWPLRLGTADTDAVVDTHQIRCSHFDAYRFFTPAARPKNLLSPNLESRDHMEQPGCLHAGMDLYKWAYKLGPLVPSALLVDCFRLALEIRELDMRASPYDLSALGYQSVPIETAAGKADYVMQQRQFAERGQLIRTRLLAMIGAVLPRSGSNLAKA